jgi:hypothetical protein
MSKSYLNDITTKFRNTVINKAEFQQFLQTHMQKCLELCQTEAAERGDYSYKYKIKLQDISSVSENNNIFAVEFYEQLSQQDFMISSIYDDKYQYFTLNWS